MLALHYMCYMCIYVYVHNTYEYITYRLYILCVYLYGSP